MKSSRQRNMGWGLSLVILCAAVVLAPRSHAYSTGQDNNDGYGTVIGIVSLTHLLILNEFRFIEAKSSNLRLSGHR